MDKTKAKKKVKKKAKRKPSLSVSNRDKKGRFASGNKVALGRKQKPIEEQSKKLKTALIDAVTEEDVKEIADKLIEKAKLGEVIAIRELFDRLWGRPPQDLGVQVTGSISFTEALSKATGRDDSD